jgi:SAM-dependent methyltransferase
MKLYDELAAWWPLLSPPEEYVGEAADLLPRIGGQHSGGAPRTLLELGSGGGSLAFHLKLHFRCTLTDIAPGMLAVSMAANPECEHILGDMHTLRLGRQFDVVLIHDAIQYATTPAAVRSALRTAALHCRTGGTVAVLPDFTREVFAPGTDHGGLDAADGRGLRYLEWIWDPDPGDDTYVADYAVELREAGGETRVVHDRHLEGLFARAEWIRWHEESGIEAASARDPYGREIFIGTRTGDSIGAAT